MSWYVVDLICIYLRNRVGTAKCSYARTSISPVFKSAHTAYSMPWELEGICRGLHASWVQGCCSCDVLALKMPEHIRSHRAQS